jgi:HK97 family phage major capsid protein
LPSPIIEASGFGRAITPEQWAAYVLDHLSAASVLLASGATEIRTDSRLVHVPRITADGAADWYDELEPIDEDGPAGDDLELTPKKVATLCRFSNEAVADSSPKVLDVAGQSMVRAVALEADRAMFAGTGGKQPLGLLNQTPELPSFDGAPNYTGIVTATGLVRAAGGTPNVVYVNPTDLTALQLATAGDDRPLISGDPTAGAPPVVAGLAIWATPALPAGTAIVAQADQIVVAVRQDASVAVSDAPLFTQDGTVARVIARVDVGVNDPSGLVVVADVTP